jgi:hypothetical protein
LECSIKTTHASDTSLQEMLIHAQAEEAVTEKEMSADDTLHAKGTVNAQNIFHTMGFFLYHKSHCFSHLSTDADDLIIIVDLLCCKQK